MPRYAWARWGDLNAFFGLILDNVAVMIVLVALITSAEPAAAGRYSREFVLTQMIPGTALGVLLGDLAYTWMALRLGRRTGRSDVTAMPLGLDHVIGSVKRKYELLGEDHPALKCLRDCLKLEGFDVLARVQEFYSN